MHSIILMTAITATSGLFGGGGRQQACTTGQCGVTYAAPVYTAQTCTTGTCGYAAPAYGYAYQQPAPAPQYYQAYAPAPAQQPMAMYRGWYRPARVSYAAPAASCPGGTCYRR